MEHKTGKARNLPKVELKNGSSKKLSFLQKILKKEVKVLFTIYRVVKKHGEASFEI